MSDLQLERSVLEAKERDELFAIALALGASPAARTKKADLVSHILQVTGVEEDATPTAEPSAEKPRRARSRRAGPTGGQDAAGDSRSEQLELASTNGHVAEEASPGQFDVPASNGAAVDSTGDGGPRPRSTVPPSLTATGRPTRRFKTTGPDRTAGARRAVMARTGPAKASSAADQAGAPAHL